MDNFSGGNNIFSSRYLFLLLDCFIINSYNSTINTKKADHKIGNVQSLFLVVLIITGVLCGLLVLYSVLVKFEVIRAPWQNKWIEISFWHVLFLFVTISTAFLWRPRENNLRYGYAEFFTKEDEDVSEVVDHDNEVPVTVIRTNDTETKMRKKKAKGNVYDSDREKNIQKTQPKFTDLEQGILEFELASEDDNDQTIENELRKME